MGVENEAKKQIGVRPLSEFNRRMDLGTLVALSVKPIRYIYYREDLVCHVKINSIAFFSHLKLASKQTGLHPSLSLVTVFDFRRDLPGVASRMNV